MKEKTYLEFVVSHNDRDQLFCELGALGDEFVIAVEYSIGDHQIIGGEISTEAATMISLKSQFLSDRMRTSSIPDSLKDRYRR